jgi:hypothetical protein
MSIQRSPNSSQEWRSAQRRAAADIGPRFSGESTNRCIGFGQASHTAQASMPLKLPGKMERMLGSGMD